MPERSTLAAIMRDKRRRQHAHLPRPPFWIWKPAQSVDLGTAAAFPFGSAARPYRRGSLGRRKRNVLLEPLPLLTVTRPGFPRLRRYTICVVKTWTSNYGGQLFSAPGPQP